MNRLGGLFTHQLRCHAQRKVYARGDPAAATPEKGRRYFDAVVEQIGSFLVELAAADPDAMYE